MMRKNLFSRAVRIGALAAGLFMIIGCGEAYRYRGNGYNNRYGQVYGSGGTYRYNRYDDHRYRDRKHDRDSDNRHRDRDHDRNYERQH